MNFKHAHAEKQKVTFVFLLQYNIVIFLHLGQYKSNINVIMPIMLELWELGTTMYLQYKLFAVIPAALKVIYIVSR